MQGGGYAYGHITLPCYSMPASFLSSTPPPSPQAWCLVERGMSNPVVAEVLGSWLADSAGAEALMRHLVADHTHLDLKEDAKVWRGVWRGGQGP